MPTPRSPGHSLGGLLGHSLVYSSVPLLGRALSIALVPFYLSWLTPAEYGVLDLADLVLVGLQQLLGQNLTSGMTRFYFEQKSAGDRRALVRSTILLLGLLATIACGAAWLARAELAPILIGRGAQNVASSELPELLGLMLLIVPFQMSSQAGLQYLQIERRSRLYASIQLGKLALELGLKIALIAYFGMGVRGFLLSVLVGELLTTLGLCGAILARTGVGIDWRVLRPALAYAAPLVPMGLCQLGLHQLDRRLLESLMPVGAGLTAVGIYGVGYKLGYLVNAVVLGPFLQIWQPWIFSVQDEQQRARLIARVSTYALLTIGSATLVVVLFAREAVVLVDSQGTYLDAWRVVPWIATAYAVWAVYQVAQIALLVAKRTGRLLAMNVCAVAFNVLANLLLVPLYGELGCAYATLASFALLAGTCMLAARLEARVRFELRRIAAVLACVACAVALAFALDLPASRGTPLVPELAAWGIKAAGLALLLGYLAFGVLHADERADLRAWLRSRRRRPAEPDRLA